MTKSQINPMPAYFDRYIDMADDVDVLESLKISQKELDEFDIEKWQKIGDKVYAEGKWTVKQIIQHIIDTERIFCYRALCIARGELVKLPSFDEAAYADNAQVNHRDLEDLLAELNAVRTATLALYQSFTDEMLLKSGPSFNGTYSVLAIGYILAGHQRWHIKVMEERYLDLI
jgi:DinB superfamily